MWKQFKWIRTYVDLDKLLDGNDDGTEKKEYIGLEMYQNHQVTTMELDFFVVVLNWINTEEAQGFRASQSDVHTYAVVARHFKQRRTKSAEYLLVYWNRQYRNGKQ